MERTVPRPLIFCRKPQKTISQKCAQVHRGLLEWGRANIEMHLLKLHSAAAADWCCILLKQTDISLPRGNLALTHCVRHKWPNLEASFSFPAVDVTPVWEWKEVFAIHFPPSLPSPFPFLSSLPSPSLPSQCYSFFSSISVLWALVSLHLQR